MPLTSRASSFGSAGYVPASIAGDTGSPEPTHPGSLRSPTLLDAAVACEKYQDETVRGIKTKRVQCDETWAFVYAKQKNVPGEHKGELTAEQRYSPAACTGARQVKIRQPGRGAHFHELHRTAQSDDAHVDAPFHAADERVLKEARQPQGGRRVLHHVVQLRANSSDPKGDAGHGSGESRITCGARRKSRDSPSSRAMCPFLPTCRDHTSSRQSCRDSPVAWPLCLV
jgi:hypothetical protein